MANILASVNGPFNEGSTWVGGVVPTIGDNAYLNNKTISIDGNITCDLISNKADGGATVGGILTLAIDGVTITANLESASVDLLTVTSDVDLTVVGNLYGGTTNSIQAIFWNSPGTLTVTGTIVAGTGGTSASALLISHAASVVNVIGDVTGSSTTAVPPISLTSTGTLNITGNLVGGSFAAAEAVETTSNGFVNITGNVSGGSATTTYGLNVAGASTVVINGNVTGGSATSAYGVINALGGTVTINGNVTGGMTSSTYGAQNASSGTLNINGTSTGSESGGAGVQNSSTGTVNIKRAKGNSWGPTGTATAVGYGVLNNNVAGVVIVEEVEYGPNGMIPTLGITFFKDTITNKCITKTASGFKTLSDPTDTDNLVPNEEDVRDGVSYAGGVKTGSLKVPISSAVAAGVLIDDTVGSAVITIPSLASVVGQIVADSLNT